MNYGLLKDLREALMRAGSAGILDRLQEFCRDPDSVNDFCDAIVSALEIVSILESENPQNPTIADLRSPRG